MLFRCSLGCLNYVTPWFSPTKLSCLMQIYFLSLIHDLVLLPICPKNDFSLLLIEWFLLEYISVLTILANFLTSVMCPFNMQRHPSFYFRKPQRSYRNFSACFLYQAFLKMILFVVIVVANNTISLLLHYAETFPKYLAVGLTYQQRYVVNHKKNC
jgi:hypothetical protein